MNPGIPNNMSGLLDGGEAAMELARETVAQIKSGTAATPLTAIEFVAPVPKTASCRDAYPFRQHVEPASRNRGVTRLPEFDPFPVYLFTTHLQFFATCHILEM